METVVIKAKIEERKKLQQEIEKTKIMISNKKENLTGNLKIVIQIEDQIRESLEIPFDKEKLRSCEQQIISLKKEKERLQQTVNELNYPQ